ncbi:MAG: hypothetical protein Q9162_001874 [Coniocarpon cinnabarinum]
MSTLRSLGVQFDVPIFNALIANASDRQDYVKAWNLFNLLADPDLQPNATTYSILFKMCRRTNDFHAFRRLFREVRERSHNPDDFSVSPSLATEMIYGVWIWNPTQIERMLRIYRRYFDLQPLSSMGLLRETEPHKLSEIQYALPSKPEDRHDTYFYGPRAPPPPLATALVLMAFLRRPDLKKELLERVYGNFKALVAAGDPLIVPVAQERITWDSFLKAFGRYRECFSQWSEIIRDMTQPSRFTYPDISARHDLRTMHRPAELFEKPDAAGCPSVPTTSDNSVTFFTPTSPMKPIKPTAQSWSIVLHAFIRHNQLESAGKILELMRYQGLAPSIVTWNGLIRASSRLGDKKKVLEALDNIENAGMQWNRYTVRAVRDDCTAWGIGRVGLGDRVKGGGLVTGRRLEHGGFELVEPQENDLSSLQLAHDEQKPSLS